MSQLKIVKKLEEIMKKVKLLSKEELVVGIPSNNNARGNDQGVTNAELGIIHEFGAPSKGIPERSFMRSTASEESKNIGKLAKINISDCLQGKKSAYDAYSNIGIYMQGKIVEKITDGDFVENKPETAKRKGSSKPLIDTGQLRASITYEVRNRES